MWSQNVLQDAEWANCWVSPVVRERFWRSPCRISKIKWCSRKISLHRTLLKDFLPGFNPQIIQIQSYVLISWFGCTSALFSWQLSKTVISSGQNQPAGVCSDSNVMYQNWFVEGNVNWVCIIAAPQGWDSKQRTILLVKFRLSWVLGSSCP